MKVCVIFLLIPLFSPCWSFRLHQMEEDINQFIDEMMRSFPFPRLYPSVTQGRPIVKGSMVVQVSSLESNRGHVINHSSKDLSNDQLLEELPIPIVDGLVLSLAPLYSRDFGVLGISPKSAEPLHYYSSVLHVDDLPGSDSQVILFFPEKAGPLPANVTVLTLVLKSEPKLPDRGVILSYRFPPLFHDNVIFNPSNSWLVATPYIRQQQDSLEVLGFLPTWHPRPEELQQKDAVVIKRFDEMRFHIPKGFRFRIVNSRAGHPAYPIGVVPPQIRSITANGLIIPLPAVSNPFSATDPAERDVHQIWSNSFFAAANITAGRPDLLPHWFHPLILVDPSRPLDPNNSAVFPFLIEMTSGFPVRHARLVQVLDPHQPYPTSDYFSVALFPERWPRPVDEAATNRPSKIDEPDNPNIHPRFISPESIRGSVRNAVSRTTVSPHPFPGKKSWKNFISTVNQHDSST